MPNTEQPQQLPEPCQPTLPLYTCGCKARSLLKPSDPRFIRDAKNEHLAWCGYPFAPARTWPGAIRDRGLSAEEVVEVIRRCPALLLEEDCKVLLEALVDLLEAASFGESKYRIKGALPELPHKLVASADAKRLELVADTPAPRRPVADHARRALQALASGTQGRGYNYQSKLLVEIVKMFRARIVHLQAEYRQSMNLKQFVATHPGDFRDFKSEKEILTLLKANKTLRAAAKLAEKETLLSAEAFLKACQKPEQ